MVVLGTISKFYIKYGGYGDIYNDWVCPARIRGVTPLENKKEKQNDRVNPSTANNRSLQKSRGPRFQVQRFVRRYFVESWRASVWPFPFAICSQETTGGESSRFQQFNQQRHAKDNARRDKQEGPPDLRVQYQRLP